MRYHWTTLLFGKAREHLKRGKCFKLRLQAQVLEFLTWASRYVSALLILRRCCHVGVTVFPVWGEAVVKIHRYCGKLWKHIPISLSCQRASDMKCVGQCLSKLWSAVRRWSAFLRQVVRCGFIAKIVSRHRTNDKSPIHVFAKTSFIGWLSTGRRPISAFHNFVSFIHY